MPIGTLSPTFFEMQFKSLKNLVLGHIKYTLEFKRLVSGTEFLRLLLIASELSFPLFEKWVALEKAVLD